MHHQKKREIVQVSIPHIFVREADRTDLCGSVRLGESFEDRVIQLPKLTMSTTHADVLKPVWWLSIRLDNFFLLLEQMATMRVRIATPAGVERLPGANRALFMG